MGHMVVTSEMFSNATCSLTCRYYSQMYDRIQKLNITCY